MNVLGRARLGLVLAVALAVALLMTQLPLSELASQRRQLAVTAAQLQLLDQRNAALRAENASLRQPATVAAIAHADYGLVNPGQQAYVILPHGGAGTPGSLGSSGDPGEARLPRSDLVAGSAAALTGVGATGGAGGAGAGGGAPGTAGGATGSFWSRTLASLEFWRWAF